MFFANIFSYAQRERLCALAYRNDARRPAPRAPMRSRRCCSVTGSRSTARGSPMPARAVADALCDPRPLRASPRRRRDVRQATRELAHTLDHLERHLAVLR